MHKVENKSKEEIAKIGRKIGEAFAGDIYERHSTFCWILTGLGVDKKTAAADACEMGRAVSAKSYEVLKTLAVLKNDRDL